MSTLYLLSHEPQGDLGCPSALECHHSLVNQEILLGLQGLLDLVVLEVLGKHFGTDNGYSFVVFHSGEWWATGLGEFKEKIALSVVTIEALPPATNTKSVPSL